MMKYWACLLVVPVVCGFLTQHNHACHGGSHEERQAQHAITAFMNSVNQDGNNLVTPQEVLVEFNTHFDPNHDTVITEQEWQHQWQHNFHLVPDFSLYLFHTLDSNNNGNVTPDDAPAFAKKMDANGNGQITKDEFKNFLLNLYKSCVAAQTS